MLDFHLGEVLSSFAIPPKAGLSISIPRNAKERKRRPGSKNAVLGRTLTNESYYGYASGFSSVLVDFICRIFGKPGVNFELNFISFP